MMCSLLIGVISRRTYRARGGELGHCNAYAGILPWIRWPNRSSAWTSAKSFPADVWKLAWGPTAHQTQAQL